MSYFSRWYVQPSIVKINDDLAVEVYNTRIATSSFSGYNFEGIEFIQLPETTVNSSGLTPSYKELAEDLSGEIYHCNVKFPLQLLKKMWNVDEIDSKTYGQAILVDANENGGTFINEFINKIIEDFIEFEKLKINKVGKFLESNWGRDGTTVPPLYKDGEKLTEEEVVKTGKAVIDRDAGFVLRYLIRTQSSVFLSGRYYVETGEEAAGSLMNLQAVLFIPNKIVNAKIGGLVAPQGTWQVSDDGESGVDLVGTQTLGLKLLREIACEPVPKPKKNKKADDPKAETKKKKLTPKDRERRKLTAKEKEAINKAVKAKLLQVSDSAFLNAILNAGNIRTRKDAFDMVLNVTPLSSMFDIAIDCLQKYIPEAPDVAVCNVIMKGLSDGDVKKILNYANANVTTDSIAAAFKQEFINTFEGSVEEDPVGFRNFCIGQFNANVGTKQIMCAMVFAALPAALVLLGIYAKQASTNLTPMGTCGDPLNPPTIKTKKLLENPVKNALLQIEKGLKNHPIISFTKNLPDNLLRQTISYVDRIIVKSISIMLQELAYLCDGSSKSDFANAAAQASPYNNNINDLLVNKFDDAVYDDLFNFLGNIDPSANVDKEAIKDFFEDIGSLLTISELCVLMTAEPTDIRYNLIIDKIFYGLLALDKYSHVKAVLNTRQKLINFINIFADRFDESACEARIEELTKNKKIFSDLCNSSDNAYMADLKDKIAQDAVNDLLNQDKDLLDDLLSALKDLAAPEIPQAFCGPAATESGIPPLLNSFQDESQIHLARKNLESILNLATKAFELEINNFKITLGKNKLVDDLPGVASSITKAFDASPELIGAMNKIYGLEATVGKDPDGGALLPADFDSITETLKQYTADNKLIAPAVYSVLQGISEGTNLDVSWIQMKGTYSGQVLKISTSWEGNSLAYYAYFPLPLSFSETVSNPELQTGYEEEILTLLVQGLSYEEAVNQIIQRLENEIQEKIAEKTAKANQLIAEFQKENEQGELSDFQLGINITIINAELENYKNTYNQQLATETDKLLNLIGQGSINAVVEESSYKEQVIYWLNQGKTLDEAIALIAAVLGAQYAGQGGAEELANELEKLQALADAVTVEMTDNGAVLKPKTTTEESSELEYNSDYMITDFDLEEDDASLSAGSTKLIFASGDGFTKTIYNGILSEQSIITPLQGAQIFDSLVGANSEKESSYKQAIKDFVEGEPLFFGEILERIIVEHAEFVSSTDLFKKQLFNNLDLSKKNPCDPSLAYFGDIVAKMEERIKSIECLVGFGVIPTPSEIVHTSSLYEATVRIVVLNEMMKMFFVFASFGLETLMPDINDPDAFTNNSFYFNYLSEKVQSRMNTLVPDEYAEGIQRAINLVTTSDLGKKTEELGPNDAIQSFVYTSIKLLQYRIANILRDSGFKTKIPDPLASPDDIITEAEKGLYSGQFLKQIYTDPTYSGANVLYEQMIKNIIPAEPEYGLLSPPNVVGVDYSKRETIIPYGFYSNNPRMKNGGFFIEQGFEILNHRALDSSQHSSNALTAENLYSLMSIMPDVAESDTTANDWIWQMKFSKLPTTLTLPPLQIGGDPQIIVKPISPDSTPPGVNIWWSMVANAKRNIANLFGSSYGDLDSSTSWLNFFNRGENTVKYFEDTMPFTAIPEFPDYETVEYVVTETISRQPMRFNYITQSKVVPLEVSQEESDLNVRAQYNYLYFIQKYLLGAEEYSIAPYDLLGMRKIKSTIFNNVTPGQEVIPDIGNNVTAEGQDISTVLSYFSDRQGRIPLASSNVATEMKYVFDAARWFSEQMDKSVRETYASDEAVDVREVINVHILNLPSATSYSLESTFSNLKTKLSNLDSYFYKFGKYRTFNLLVRIHDESDVDFIFNSLKKSLEGKTLRKSGKLLENGEPTQITSNIQSFTRSVLERKYFLREESQVEGTPGNLYFKLPLVYKYDPITSLEDFEEKVGVTSILQDALGNSDGTYGFDSQTIVDSFKTLFDSIQYKDLLSFVSIMITETLNSEYPSLNDIFKNTILTLGTGTKQSLEISDRVNNPDIYKSEIDAEAYNGTRVSNPDALSDFIAGLVKGIANMTDPTWRTPWFLPGPLTPFGIITKILEGEEDSDDANKAIEKNKEENKSGAEKSVDCNVPPKNAGQIAAAIQNSMSDGTNVVTANLEDIGAAILGAGQVNNNNG